jgi:hypothetical protein
MRKGVSTVLHAPRVRIPELVVWALFYARVPR